MGYELWDIPGVALGFSAEPRWAAQLEWGSWERQSGLWARGDLWATVRGEAVERLGTDSRSPP